MSSHPQARITSYMADADLSSKQYYAMKIGSDSKHINIVSDANGKSIGFLMNKPSASGQFAEIAGVGGGALGKLAESVAAMAQLTCTANGDLEVVDAAGEVCVAIALEAGDSGDVIAIDVVNLEPHAGDA